MRHAKAALWFGLFFSGLIAIFISGGRFPIVYGIAISALLLLPIVFLAKQFRTINASRKKWVHIFRLPACFLAGTSAYLSLLGPMHAYRQYHFITHQADPSWNEVFVAMYAPVIMAAEASLFFSAVFSAYLFFWTL